MLREWLEGRNFGRKISRLWNTPIDSQFISRLSLSP